MVYLLLLPLAPDYSANRKVCKSNLILNLKVAAIVYMHDAMSTSICKNDVISHQNCSSNYFQLLQITKLKHLDKYITIK